MKTDTNLRQARTTSGPAGTPLGSGPPDVREQTFNDGLTGAVTAVSTPAALVTRLRKIWIDLDPKLLRPELYAGTDGSDGERLYERTARSWFDRHPLLRSAEVRSSGTGLHVLLPLDPHVTFDTDADRDRWAAMVKAVQRTLPSDPNAPGLTALTRPVGSVSSKSGRTVTSVRAGTPVRPDAVAAFVKRLQRAPFAVVAGVLCGPDPVRPCPVCRAADSSLAVKGRQGKCYRCGTVTLTKLFGTVTAVPAAPGGH